MGPTDTPTKAEARRMSLLADIGCIAHQLDDWPHCPAQIHHVLSGGRRQGHAQTIPLCEWHHVGRPPTGMTMLQTAMVHGHSLALEPRKFADRYGTEAQLVELCDLLVAWLDEDCTRSTLMVRSGHPVLLWHRDRLGQDEVPKAKRRKWQRKSIKAELAHGAS